MEKKIKIIEGHEVLIIYDGDLYCGIYKDVEIKCYHKIDVISGFIKYFKENKKIVDEIKRMTGCSDEDVYEIFKLAKAGGDR